MRKVQVFTGKAVFCWQCHINYYSFRSETWALYLIKKLNCREPSQNKEAQDQRQGMNMQYCETFKRLKATFLLLGALFLTACGGGGGGSDSGFTPNSGDQQLPIVYFVTAELFDSSGTKITEVPIGSVADIVITILEGRRIEDAAPVQDVYAP